MMEKQYDYLIVGAGIYGATFACMAHRQGKRCLVIDKRNHLGGNIYLSSSIAIPILLSRIIKVSSITCPLI